MNVTDEDAEKLIKYFTLLSKEEIEDLVEQHAETPHLRLLQKALAKDVTIRVHSEDDYNMAVEASTILFGKGTTEVLKGLPENIFLSVFEGVPQFEVQRNVVDEGIGVIDFLAETTSIFASKGEARRMLKDNGVSVNKAKVKDNYQITQSDLLNNKYIIVQKGKRNYFLVQCL